LLSYESAEDPASGNFTAYEVPNTQSALIMSYHELVRSP